MRMIWKRAASMLLIVLLLTAVVQPAMAASLLNPPTEFACSSNFGSDFVLEFGYQAADWASAITGVTVAGETYEKAGYSFGVNRNKSYYVRSTDGYVYIGEGFEGETADCIITASGYDALTLRLNKSDYSAVRTEGTAGG